MRTADRAARCRPSDDRDVRHRRAGRRRRLSWRRPHCNAGQYGNLPAAGQIVPAPLLRRDVEQFGREAAGLAMPKLRIGAVLRQKLCSACRIRRSARGPAPPADPSARSSRAGARWRSPCGHPSARRAGSGSPPRPPSPVPKSPRPAPGSARPSGSPAPAPRAAAARRTASRRARRHARRSRGGRASPPGSG